MPQTVRTVRLPRHNRVHPTDSLGQHAAHHGEQDAAFRQPSQEQFGICDEPATLRGRDGLTDIEREALAHRYDVVVRVDS